jgi:catechol 2,3-dioxygenase-like lactoylglutathione lyase family enzyme
VFDHVTIRASDREASERFYDTVLPVLGLYSEGGFAEWGDYSLAQASEEKPATQRLHVAFHAASRELVDEFWRVGTDAGYRDDGAPGPRPQYRPDYYGAFLLDPDGNSVEAVTHEIPPTAPIDHLWIRVSDPDASRRFYETVAPWTGFESRGAHKFGVGFASSAGSFSLIPGDPTRNAHIAFPADSNEAVDEFHRAALGAGYRDNGSPAERPVYHEGYYGAFVLDPDGNNVEVVNHNR